ncbi:hypothetical protein J2X90_005939 [Variovorax paradoxus]|uniref:hypothetical protein n=1 Tax=Variovorax paradoxus TaxID=34073 RepID=UPI0027843138|nr:hypothetical protein [Variovorax paradoxus]MDQ0028086.1 hypothetical protein [Variovorax paradoxus]
MLEDGRPFGSRQYARQRGRLPQLIGPHGPKPPSHGQVSGGDAGAEAEVNFDDDEIYSGTGNNTRRGGTSKSAGGDSGALGPPSEQLSDSNQPREKNANGAR